MKFNCYDIKTKSNIYSYKDINDQNTCEKCFLNNNHFHENNGLCNKGNYYLNVRDNKNNYFFIFCFDKLKVKKKAKLHARILMDIFIQGIEITQHKNNQRLDNVDFAIHNTKNILAQVNSKIFKLVNEKELSKSKNKIDYIKKLLMDNVDIFAKELLSVLKSLTQMDMEYELINYLKPGINLKKSEFSTHKIHHLLVLTYYLYEEEFKEKDIHFNIQHTDEKIFVNFNTIKTGITQILDNALKYCYKGKPINVKINIINDDFIDISFEMLSVFVGQDEINKIIIEGERGVYAEKIAPTGKGLGLGVIQKMVSLNKGKFTFEFNEKTRFYSGEIPYSENKFNIQLLRKEPIPWQ